jgi:hypothetical protein
MSMYLVEEKNNTSLGLRALLLLACAGCSMMVASNLTSIIQNTDSFQTANHGPVNQSFWGCRISQEFWSEMAQQDPIIPFIPQHLKVF